jgi:hypothetical protein
VGGAGPRKGWGVGQVSRYRRGGGVDEGEGPTILGLRGYLTQAHDIIWALMSLTTHGSVE